MDREGPNTKDIVAATMESGTARLRCFSRLGCPKPEPCDLRGEGIADFAADRVWMTDRLVTQRIASQKRRESNLLARPFFWILFRSLERMFVGDEEVLFEGGAVRNRKRGANESWGPPLGSIDQPKYPRHPLCAFAPLAKANMLGAAATRVESQEGVETQCWEVSLSPSAFQSEVWREITDGEQTVSSIQAMVWIDKKLRVNRLAFEASRQSGESDALWSITELWGFGVDVAEMSSTSQIEVGLTEPQARV
jgi:hypothetical protein